MSWQGIEGHDAVVERFRRAMDRGRLASTFLFVGPPGVGKRSFALKLAQSMLCQSRTEAALDPCGVCPACQQVLAGTHPDLQVISKPADKSFLPVALFIGDKEHRMHEGLCHSISLKPFMGGRKIAIIDDADYLNIEGANCLLKTLEEPPPQSVLILIGTSIDRQLPTIRSRCQIIRFGPLPEDTISRLLVEKEVVADAAEARRLAKYSEGSLDRAVELTDPELWSFRRDMLGQLARPNRDSVRLAQEVVAFVEQAGKEASARRARARQLIGFAAEFYRQLLRGRSGLDLPDDPDLEILLRQALQSWQGGEDAIVACLERTLEALTHVDRNANQTTLLECWIDDLAAIEHPAQQL